MNTSGPLDPTEPTIVTAYYSFEKKKYPTQAYIQWMHNFLPHCDSYMIIFTDEYCYDFLANLRKDHKAKTLIIKLPIEQFYVFKYMNHWYNDLQRDHETYHSISLYLIWNEKSMFMKRAISMNPFHTDYFCWTDIGCVRNPANIPYIKKYPRVSHKIKKDKFYLLNIQHTFTEEDFAVKELATERFRYKNAIGGTIMFAHKDVFSQWIDKYYEMLEEFVQKDYFAGKDQSLMACIYIKNRDMIELVRPEPSPINEDWFYMLWFLSAEST
jgi:Bacterial protein of unknown function (HtrL_YibB)